MDLQGKSNGQGTNPFYLHESLRTGRKMRAVRRESRVFRALMNNAILRSQGHTRAEQQERSEKPCIVCGASPILCRGVCGKCYSSMRAHKFTTPEQLLEYKETKKKRKEQ